MRRDLAASIGVICLLRGEWGGHEVAMKNACSEFVPCPILLNRVNDVEKDHLRMSDMAWCNRVSAPH